MLMKPNPNKNATMVLQAGKAPVENEMDGAEQELDAADLAAEEILAAITSGDSKALSEALKAHYEMCSASENAE
jgi:hypothetical protein